MSDSLLDVDIDSVIQEKFLDSIKLLSHLLAYIQKFDKNFYPGGAYTNTRDALFHFRKIFNLMKDQESELTEVTKLQILYQIENIDHHMNRALSDAVQHLVLRIVTVIGNILKQSSERPTLNKQTAQIRFYYHKLKNILLDVRLLNMEIKCLGIEEKLKAITEAVSNVETITQKQLNQWLKEIPQ